MENDNIITRPNGSRYEYDSDFDVYRRIPDASEFGHMQQFGWIYVCTILAVICWYVTK